MKIKSHILFVILGLFYNNAIAQNNLQFNAAKYISLSGNGISNGVTSIVATSIITVPAGKVWKIESASANGVGGSSNNIATDFVSSYAGIALNGVIISSSTYYNNNTPTSTLSRPLFPIWLPTGTYTITLVGVYGVYGAGPVAGYVSAVEFNLVQ